MSENPPPLPPSPPALTPEQLLELQEARRAHRPIRRTISVAKFDAWSVAIFAALTFIGGFPSAVGIILGLGMGVIAFVEFRALGHLQKLDEQSPRLLALNQLGLAALLIGYALWMLVSGSTAKTINDAINETGMADQLKAQIPNLASTIIWCISGSLVAVAVFVQGGMALYYDRKQKRLQEYLRDTPPWILQMQQAGMSI